MKTRIGGYLLARRIDRQQNADVRIGAQIVLPPIPFIGRRPKGDRQAPHCGVAAVLQSVLRDNPPALQLRYLQTLTEMTGNGNSTVIPVTMDLLGGLKTALGAESK